MNRSTPVTMMSRFVPTALTILAVSASIPSALANDQGRPAAKANEKEWTILTFISGNNNLDEFGNSDLNEMEAVGSTPYVNVVVQRGSLMATQVKRYLVQKDADPTVVTTQPLEEIPDAQADMGSAQTLKEFLAWGVKNFPAKHYFVNVWNHGAGWHDAGFDGVFSDSQSGFSILDIAFDDKTGSYIKTEEMGAALAEMKQLIGRNVDIYGNDACLMNMVEIGSEVADSVNLMVGSEEVEPVEGWPYDQWLQEWATAPGATPAQVAGSLVRQYVASYSGGSQGTKDVQLSALDLSRTSAMHTAMKALVDEMKILAPAQKTKLVKELNSAFNFAYADYADLGDVLKRVDGVKAEGLDARTVQRARDAVTQYVLANAGSGTYATEAHGAAVWLPMVKYTFENYKARYKSLKFNQATGWLDALEFLHQ